MIIFSPGTRCFLQLVGHVPKEAGKRDIVDLSDGVDLKDTGSVAIQLMHSETLGNQDPL